MTHLCGIVIENVLQRDQGSWTCNMDLVDKQSKSHRVEKVIDLNVKNRRQSPKRQRHIQRKTRDDRFDLYGYGDGYGSGSGVGPIEDEIPKGEQSLLNKIDKCHSKHLSQVL